MAIFECLLEDIFGTTMWVVQRPAPNGERGLKQNPNKAPQQGNHTVTVNMDFLTIFFAP